MKVRVAIFCFLITITSAKAQKWENIAGNIRKFCDEKDSTLLPNASVYEKEGKFIIIERSTEFEFTNLFKDDTCAFDIIYNKCPQTYFMFLYDSVVAPLLDASQTQSVINLYNLKVENDKNTIKWSLESPRLGSPGCHVTFSLRRERKNNIYLMKLIDATGYCLIP